MLRMFLYYRSVCHDKFKSLPYWSSSIYIYICTCITWTLILRILLCPYDLILTVLFLQLTILGNRLPVVPVTQVSAQQETIVASTAVADYSPSSTSSSSSSANSSPTVTPNSPTPYQRPSTLHGLKHKLHSVTKNLHSPNRRKSVGHIPLSPLARTPSPSPLPQSPTRSPSPLTFSAGHQPGSSNTTQSYSPSSLLSNPNASGTTGSTGSSGMVSAVNGVTGCCKKTAGSSFGRPCKTSEPGSPLLRRALSPDRLHPRTAETKSNSISPLCDPALKVTMHHAAPRVTVTTKSPPMCVRSASTPADSPLVKTIITTTRYRAIPVEKMVLPAAIKTPPATATVMKMPSSATIAVDMEQVNTKMDGNGHVSLPRIAEERDQLLQQQQQQYQHQHQHQQQLTAIPVAAVDKPTKPMKTTNGSSSSRYFFNRKYKQGNKDNHQQQSVKTGFDMKDVSPQPPPSPWSTNFSILCHTSTNV